MFSRQKSLHGASIIRPRMGQVLLVVITNLSEYIVNSTKWFAPLSHKMALLQNVKHKRAIINTLLLTQMA